MISKILVLCGTFDVWWVLCEVVLSLQSRAFIGSVTRVGAAWVKAGGACVHTWCTITCTQLVNQAAGMSKLGTSEPSFPWQHRSARHSVREHVLVLMQELELPEEQKGGRLQREICSALFVVGVIACLVQAVQD